MASFLDNSLAINNHNICSLLSFLLKNGLLGKGNALLTYKYGQMNDGFSEDSRLTQVILLTESAIYRLSIWVNHKSVYC